MSRQLRFEIGPWVAGSPDEGIDGATLAPLRIVAGEDDTVMTEVEDTAARTVRGEIFVPASAVARWLLVHWWRLRWEPRRGSVDWLETHSMASIGGGYAWPSLTFSSDGELVQVSLQSEPRPDAASIRYLTDANIEVPARDFERAVDDLVALVEARSSSFADDRQIAELREELDEERRDPKRYRACKVQALAGEDPGSVSDAWLARALSLADETGSRSSEEILAVSPELEDGLTSAMAAVDAMQRSNVSVDLGWASAKAMPHDSMELPWERGVRHARRVRNELGIGTGPLAQDTFGKLLGTTLPMPTTAWSGSRAFLGGYRSSFGEGRATLLFAQNRVESQRFYLARVVGAACIAGEDDRVLPVSRAATAFQKAERAFAQEFLCPWQELDAFTDERGTDEDGVAEAAEYFQVSELLVTTTLVNRRKIPRRRLDA